MKNDAENVLAKAVGKAISKKRAAKGLTQEEVAEQLNIGYEAVSRIERGVVMPTIARLSELADIFECGIDELLIETSNRSEDQADYLASLLAKLGDSDRAMIVEIVEKLSSRLHKTITRR